MSSVACIFLMEELLQDNSDLHSNNYNTNVTGLGLGMTNLVPKRNDKSKYDLKSKLYVKPD